MTAHARLSPSAAHRWQHCPGSVALESALPESSSTYADEGTAAHTLASWVLEQKRPASDFIGVDIKVERKNSMPRIFTVDDDMAGYVQNYADTVRDYVGHGELLVEQRVEFSSFIGVAEQFGTSDAIGIVDDELVVIDLKYGRGVRVDAEDNPQAMLYALGSLHEFGWMADFQSVRIVIVQPRLGHVSEWAIPVLELEQWAESQAKPRALIADSLVGETDATKIELYLKPDEDACRFCKAKATCPKLRSEVARVVYDEPAALEADFAPEQACATAPTTPDQLGYLRARLPIIRAWCDAIEERVEQELRAGGTVPGFKIVAGKKGARAWSSADEAEAALKAMRLKQEEMYDFKLISPTAAEKLHKAGVLGPKQWAKLQDLIGQKESAPTVVPSSDPRAPLVIAPLEEDFV